jgi:hypothetical protein
VNVRITHFLIKKKLRNILKWELAGSHLCPVHQGRSNEPKSAIFFIFCNTAPPFSPVSHRECAVKLQRFSCVACGLRCRYHTAYLNSTAVYLVRQRTSRSRQIKTHCTFFHGKVLTPTPKGTITEPPVLISIPVLRTNAGAM